MGNCQSYIVQAFSNLSGLRSAMPRGRGLPLIYMALFACLTVPCALFMAGCSAASDSHISSKTSSNYLSASCTRFVGSSSAGPVADTYATPAVAALSAKYPENVGNYSQRFIPVNVVSDSLGFHHVKFQQTYAGLPIYNQILIVHLNQHDKPYAISGHPVVLNQIESGRCLSPDAAAGKLKSATSKSGQQVGTLQLWLDQNRDARLAYIFDVSAGANSERIIVSALTGAVLKTYPLSYSTE